MRKTSYVVTFLLVLVSLALVSHFINLSIVSVKKTIPPITGLPCYYPHRLVTLSLLSLSHLPDRHCQVNRPRARVPVQPDRRPLWPPEALRAPSGAGTRTVRRLAGGLHGVQMP